MKIFRLAGLALAIGVSFSTTTLAALSHGNWTKVEALYTYLGGGGFCGINWEGVTLVQLEPGNTTYSGDCRPNSVAVDTSMPGGQMAMSTILSAHARGAEIKINVDDANTIVCEQNGMTYCKAVQVNTR